jgi:hypothetical protein
LSRMGRCRNHATLSIVARVLSSTRRLSSHRGSHRYYRRDRLAVLSFWFMPVRSFLPERCSRSFDKPN